MAAQHFMPIAVFFFIGCPLHFHDDAPGFSIKMSDVSRQFDHQYNKGRHNEHDQKDQNSAFVSHNICISFLFLWAIKGHKARLCPLIAPPPEGGEGLKKVTEPGFRQ